MTVLLRGRTEVVKVVSPGSSEPGSATDLGRYVAGLRSAGVPLPEDLRIDAGAAGPAVRYRWIPGPTLLELPGSRSREFRAAVDRIAGWVRALEPTDVRLDTNLANFVLPGDGQLVCIDVLPPLLASSRRPEASPWEQLIGGLCYDTHVTLCALAGYAARHLLRTLDPGELPVTGRRRLTGLCPGHPDPAALPATWFHSRLAVAGRALAGQLTHQQALEVFSATSILALQAAPAVTQAAHVAAALALAGGLAGGRTLDEPPP
jgi:hypothetical protein